MYAKALFESSRRSLVAPKAAIITALLASLVLAACSDSDSGSADSATWEPTKEVKVVIPFEPGGGTDLLGRALASGLMEVRDINVTVENRAGSGGAVGLSYLKGQAGDAHFLFPDSTAAMMLPIVGGLDELPWQEWSHIRLLATDPMIVVSAGSGDWSSFEDLVAAAKAADTAGKPLTMAISSTLETFYKALLERELGVEFGEVRFDGDGESHVAISAGDVDFGLGNVGDAGPLVESGRLKALASLSENPVESDLMPGLPTAESLGYDVRLDIYRSVMAPPGIPDEAAEYWAAAVEDWTKTESFEKWVADNNVVPRAETGDDFTAFLEQWESTVSDLTAG